MSIQTDESEALQLYFVAYCISLVGNFQAWKDAIGFRVAVHLSSNRSQMTSKCGKNKKVAHEAIAECVTDVRTTHEKSLLASSMIYTK